MNNVTKALIEGKAIIANPENWTQGVFARDVKGKEVDVHNNDAVCFCTIGALRKTEAEIIYGSEVYKNARQYLSVAAQDFIADYNDNHTHDEVMVMWDKAIEASKMLGKGW